MPLNDIKEHDADKPEHEENINSSTLIENKTRETKKPVRKNIKRRT